VGGHATRRDQVLAFYETNARDFLYPTVEVKSMNHGGQRDVFLNKQANFPVELLSNVGQK
jgi:hypothetical protein